MIYLFICIFLRYLNLKSVGWDGKGSPQKLIFAVSLGSDWKGTGCIVPGENFQDPVDHYFNARREVSRNFLKQNRKARITKIQNLELLLSS